MFRQLLFAAVVVCMCFSPLLIGAVNVSNAARGVNALIVVSVPFLSGQSMFRRLRQSGTSDLI